MSHTVKTKGKVNIFEDAKFLKRTAVALGYEVMPVEIKKGFKLYQPTVHKERAIAVQLPGWKYPVYFTEDGSEILDNYEGAWGSMAELEKFKNVFMAEKQIDKAIKNGCKVKSYKIDKTGKVKVKLVEA